jgi:aryl-alcohol dehydrogenase-like predicted oxidoreductase
VSRRNGNLIVTASGEPASILGLAAHPEQDPQCIPRAFERGINLFFFYGPGHKLFANELTALARRRRDDIIIGSGSGSRKASGLRTARRKILAAIGTETVDIFFAEYINPGDNVDAVFGTGGVLDELQRWKAEGAIRFVGASAHDRQLAKRLAEDSRVDVLMHRYNMAHRKAAVEVFPAAMEARTPIIAFTATRWGTLLKPHPVWPGEPPSAADCYRFCLAQAAVHVALTAPRSIAELDQNIEVLKSKRMNARECAHWERYGDIIYSHGGRQEHDYESRWP